MMADRGMEGDSRSIEVGQHNMYYPTLSHDIADDDGLGQELQQR